MSDAIEENTASEATAPEVTPAATAPTDEVAAKLKEFKASDEAIDAIRALGVETVADLSELTESDLVNAGLQTVQTRKLLKAVAPATVDVPVAAAQGAAIATVLPQVPNYESLLDMLRTGGVLKVDRSSVTAAVQAWIANRAGLFELPKRLAEEILAFAKKNDEPVDPTVYYKLKTQLSRVRYGDLFAAIEGFDGRSISAASKKELFDAVELSLIPALVEFQDQLSGWHNSWITSGNNPLALQQALNRIGGGRMGVVPSATQAPDTGLLRDQADKVSDAANRVFGGEGVQVAAAVAFETGKIREILRDPSLPARIGAANQEQMLKQLGATVSAADPRFESNLVQYVLSVLQVKNLTGGDEELQYFDVLKSLGDQIPWSQLNGSSRNARMSRLGGAAMRAADL